MAFFDLPKEDDIPPAARHWLDELKRLRGITTIPASRLAYVSTPWILEAQVTAEANLFNQVVLEEEWLNKQERPLEKKKPSEPPGRPTTDC